MGEGRGGEEDKERPYCSSTGPRLVSVITDRSLRGEPFDVRGRTSARPSHKARKDPVRISSTIDPRRNHEGWLASIDSKLKIRDRVADLG